MMRTRMVRSSPVGRELVFGFAAVELLGVNTFRDAHADEAAPRLTKLRQIARERKNTFEALMEAAKECSLGSMSHALYDVGGEYRRNM